MKSSWATGSTTNTMHLYTAIVSHFSTDTNMTLLILSLHLPEWDLKVKLLANINKVKGDFTAAVDGIKKI